MKSTICIAEDRASCEPALKLLALSLKKHCPSGAVHLFYPIATRDFSAWIQRCPQVTLRTDRLMNGYGWNVKPQAIMRLFDEGYEEVIWIDSDVLVIRDMADIFSTLASNAVVATEDALGDERTDGNAIRAQLWGFQIGRTLPFGLNTGVLRVTRDHYRLVARWWELLQSGPYREAQSREWRQRPLHMLGDQDVLTALLTSSEFSKVPLHILRRGRQILQFNGVFGYTVAERVSKLLGARPTFIHSFAGKPWSEPWRTEPSAGLMEYIKKVYLDLSPYTLSARQFRGEVACDTEWMEPHYRLTRLLRLSGMGQSALVGLPLAVVADLMRVLKWIRKSMRTIHAPLRPDGSATES